MPTICDEIPIYVCYGECSGIVRKEHVKFDADAPTSPQPGDLVGTVQCPICKKVESVFFDLKQVPKDPHRCPSCGSLNTSPFAPTPDGMHCNECDHDFDRPVMED
jgi:hypothetical protein